MTFTEGITQSSAKKKDMNQMLSIDHRIERFKLIANRNNDCVVRENAMIYRITKTKTQYIELIKWIEVLNARSRALILCAPNEALRLGKRTYRLAQKCGSQEGRALSLLMMGYANRALSNNTQCIKDMLVASQIFEDLRHQKGQMRTLNLLGINYFYFGKYEQAMAYLSKSLVIARDIGDQFIEASILNNIGEIHRQLEQYGEALLYYEEALAISESLHNLSNIAAILLNMGHIYSRLNQGAKALVNYQKSQKYSSEVGDKILIGEALNNIGKVYEKLQEDQLALQYYLDSLSLLEECGNKFYSIDALVSVGKLFINQKQDKGLAYLRKALILAEELSAKNECAKIHILLSSYYEARQDFEKALDHFKSFSAIEKKVRHEKLEENLKLVATEFRVNQLRKETEIFRFKNIELKKKNEEIEKNAQLLATANQELTKLHEQLKRVNQRLKLLSTIDQVTRIPNRRCLDDTLKREWTRCLREGKSLSLILVDIDNFKLYNDTYGHLQGDKCLRKVAKALASVLKRSSDFVGRFGGEEFAAILANVDYDNATKVAEKIRKCIEGLKIVYEQSPTVPYITISLGVATITPTFKTSFVELISAADQKMYQAKRQGRNQICAVYL
jgi:diguanylate cyclase (GGDEF)-like protein